MEKSAGKNSSSNPNEEQKIPALYRMELSKGYFNCNNGIQSNEALTSEPLPRSTQSNEQLLSYNDWKSQNNTFDHSQSKICSGEGMVSNLGRSLEQWQLNLPKSSSSNSPPNLTETTALYCNMQSVGVGGNRILDGGEYHAINTKSVPNSMENMRHYNQVEFQNTPHHYFGVGNSFNSPAKCYSDANFQINPLRNMMYTPPMCHQNYDMHKHKMPPTSAHDIKETPFRNPYYQPTNFSPQHNFRVDDHYRPKEHFDQTNNSRNHILKETDNTCRCCNIRPNTKQQKKFTKNETSNNKHIKDLYRIVYLQNQQLGLLQKQVQALIEFNFKDKKCPNSQDGSNNKKYVKETTEKRTFNLSVIKENEDIHEKVSVGIMTSFIENNYAKICNDKDVNVSNKNAKKSKNREYIQDDTSSHSSTDDDRKSSNGRDNVLNNKSFTLNDVVPAIEENLPSPQTSVHIDMQEYTSSGSESDSESTSDASEENSPAPVGWTFYDTVVGKVNDMLKQPSDEEENDSDKDDVRNATIDQLRHLGVSFMEPESPTTKRVTFNSRKNKPKHSNYHQLQCDSETSFHINSLANKYLKMSSNKNPAAELSPPKLTNNQNNLSYATLRYLDRYQLSPNDTKSGEQQKENKNKKKKKTKKMHNSKGKEEQSKNKCGKILDITAIKKQPKLLPKN